MTEARAVRRSLRRAALVGALAAFALFALLLTYGRPWQLTPRETLGNFYDAQAESFSHGHLTVDPAEVSFEGFRIGSRTYEYQGPIPALMRLPIVLVTHRFHGRLTRLSMSAAYLVALWFVVQLQLEAREVVRGSAAVTTVERLATAVTTFGLGASSLLFLASKAWVYHEALLWGAAFSLGSLVHLLAWLRAGAGADGSGDTAAEPAVARASRRPSPVVWAAVFAGLALLTRSSVGLGPVAALAAAAVVQAKSSWSRRGGWAGGGIGGHLERLSGWRPRANAGLAVLVIGVVVPIGIYAAVNQAKFGSPFSLPADKQVLVQFDPAAQQALAANHGSLFSPKFTPSVALQALRPDALSVSDHFPFVGFPAHRPRALGGARFEELDWSSSVPSSEPLLFVLGLLGLAVVVAPRWLLGDRGAAVFRIPVLGGLVGCVAFLTIGYMANRYLTDLFPLLAIATVVGVQALLARLTTITRPAAPRLAVGGLAVLALLGAWANVGMGLEYQRVVAPGAPAGSRASWIDWQDRLGAELPFTRVGLMQPLPAHPGLGAIAVVGACAGLYRSDGSIWQTVEGTDAVGQFVRDLTLRATPTRPLTLIAGTGTAGVDRLLVVPVGGGRLEFTASVERDGQTTRSLPGPAIRLDPGRTYRLSITFDWRSGYAEVDHGSTQWLASNIALVPAVPQVVSGPKEHMVDRSRPAATCRRLVG